MNPILFALALAGGLAMPDPRPIPVTNGTDATTCQWPSVAALRLGDGTAYCSASLIHPQVVLTAGHCVEPMTGAIPASIAFGESAASPAAVVGVERCAWHPDYEIIAGGTDAVTEVKNDLAYCVLTEPIAEIPIVPILMGCEADTLAPDAIATIVGFGASMGGIMNGMTWHAGSGTKRFTEQSIDVVDGRSGDVIMVGAQGNSVCFGDSGGPALLQLADGTWRVLGVGSTLHPDFFDECGHGAIYQIVHAHAAWIEADAGFDLSACFAADGTWDPTQACGSFPTDPLATTSVWTNGCATRALGDASATCGAPFEETEPTGSSSGADSTTSADDSVGDTADASSGAVEPSTGHPSAETSGSSEEAGGEMREGAAGCGCAARRRPGAWPGVAGLGLLLLPGRTRSRRRTRDRPIASG